MQLDNTLEYFGATVAGVLESVNQRTNHVGQNRLALLLFRLGGPQLYGINVFKVREVLNYPKLHVLRDCTLMFSA